MYRLVTDPQDRDPRDIIGPLSRSLMWNRSE